MSVSDLINFVSNENHVKFRSHLSEMLYARLSEAVKEKTKDMVSEIFETERIVEASPIVEYISNVLNETEKSLGISLTEEEITEATNHIISLFEEEEEEEEEGGDIKIHVDQNSHEGEEGEAEEEEEEEEEEDEDEEDEEEDEEDEEDEDEEDEEEDEEKD